MTALRKLPLTTIDEFLALPDDGTKYELVDGVLRAMANTSRTHGRIHANLTIALGNYLRAHRPGCGVIVEPGIQPHVRAGINFRIPDIGVTCTKEVPGARMVDGAVLLIEILSPSNAQATWDNVRNYTTIPSVQDILIVDSEGCAVQLLARDSQGNWPMDPLDVSVGAVPLASIGYDLPLAEIYRDTGLA